MNLNSRAILLPSIVLLIGAISATAITGNAYAQDPFKNKVDLDAETDHLNSCDESGKGDNNANCALNHNTSTEPVVVEGEENEVSSDMEAEQKNSCDEKNDGDNNAQCAANSNQALGPIIIGPPVP